MDERIGQGDHHELTTEDGWKLLHLLGLYGWSISVVPASAEPGLDEDRVEGVTVHASLLGRRTITHSGFSVADVAADLYEEAISGTQLHA